MKTALLVKASDLNKCIYKFIHQMQNGVCNTIIPLLLKAPLTVRCQISYTCVFTHAKLKNSRNGHPLNPIQEQGTLLRISPERTQSEAEGGGSGDGTPLLERLNCLSAAG